MSPKRHNDVPITLEFDNSKTRERGTGFYNSAPDLIPPRIVLKIVPVRSHSCPPWRTSWFKYWRRRSRPVSRCKVPSQKMACGTHTLTSPRRRPYKLRLWRCGPRSALTFCLSTRCDVSPIILISECSQFTALQVIHCMSSPIVTPHRVIQVHCKNCLSTFVKVPIN